MQTSAIGLLLVITVLPATHGRQSYSVLAPRAIRPNTNYYAAVSVDGTDGDLQVISKIGDDDDDDDVIGDGIVVEIDHKIVVTQRKLKQNFIKSQIFITLFILLSSILDRFN